MIISGRFAAASKNWRTAFARSDTGYSHQPSHWGCSGVAWKVSTTDISASGLVRCSTRVMPTWRSPPGMPRIRSSVPSRIRVW